MGYGCAIGLCGIVVVAAWKRHIRRQFNTQRIAGEHILRHHAEFEIVVLTIVRVGVCCLVHKLDKGIEIGVERSEKLHTRGSTSCVKLYRVHAGESTAGMWRNYGTTVEILCSGAQGVTSALRCICTRHGNCATGVVPGGLWHWAYPATMAWR